MLEYTDGKLDLALNGPGFFSVQGPNGPLYTRNGVFEPNAQGQLVTSDGLRVESVGNLPIAVPLDTARGLRSCRMARFRRMGPWLVN